jgi:acyl-CoA thioesterase
MSRRFDLHTQVTRSEAGLAAELRDTWRIGPAVNGGYQLAVACRAALLELGVDDVVNVSAYFISPTAAGPATLDVEVIKRGRTSSLAQVRIVQDGRERVRALVLGGSLAAFTGPEHHTESAPELPPPDACVGVPGPLQREIDMRFDPSTAAFLRGQTSDRAEHRAWVRLADAGAPDVLALVTFADVLPPTTFNVFGMTSWVPTLELTVQIRRRPAPGWVRAHVITRHISAGHLEEDCSLWDEAGQLVALSRQRAMLLAPAT